MFIQSQYISNYNKKKYKMYQFRIKKDSPLVDVLDSKESRNAYIVSLIENDLSKNVLKLSDIKKTAKAIFANFGIFEIFLFGSYARGDANNQSDVDILCEKGNVKTLLDQAKLEEELETALGKKVDIVFTSAKMNPYFYEQIKEDLIKLC